MPALLISTIHGCLPLSYQHKLHAFDEGEGFTALQGDGMAVALDGWRTRLFDDLDPLVVYLFDVVCWEHFDVINKPICLFSK